MAKTKAEVAKMVRAQKIKQFSKLTLEQRKIKNGEIMRSARRNTAVGKIELSVLKKLVLPEQKANKARTELKKTVPTTKKKVSRAELDKARVALQKKPVPKGSHRMPDGSIMKDSAMKKKPAPKKTPAPTLDSLQAVMAVMTDVGKENKSRYRPPEKWDPYSTPPLKLLKGEDKWTVVRIFNRNGTGKGKIYEASFQVVKGRETSRREGQVMGKIDEKIVDFTIIGIRDMETKKIIGFGYDDRDIKSIEKIDPKSDRDYTPRLQFRFAGKEQSTFKYKKKLKGQLDIKYEIGGLVKYMEKNDIYMNLPRESDKIQKAFKYGKYNDYETDDASKDLIYKVSFGTPVYRMNELRINTSYTY